MEYVGQADAIAKGKEFWEQEYGKLLANRDQAIALLMQECEGMESAEVLEDFATLQVNDLIRGYRNWIDETFK